MNINLILGLAVVAAVLYLMQTFLGKEKASKVIWTLGSWVCRFFYGVLWVICKVGMAVFNTILPPNAPKLAFKKK